MNLLQEPKTYLMPSRSFKIFSQEMAEKDGHITDRLLETYAFAPIFKKMQTIHLIQVVLLRKHLSHAAAREIGNRLNPN